MADGPQNMAAVVECDIELEVSAIANGSAPFVDELFAQVLCGIMVERNKLAAQYDVASGDVIRPDVWCCRDLIFVFSHPRFSMKLIGLFDLFMSETQFRSDKDRGDKKEQKTSNVALVLEQGMQRAELDVSKSSPFVTLPIFERGTWKCEILDYESIDVARIAFNALRVKSRFDSGVLSDWYDCHLASDHRIRINRFLGNDAILTGHDPTSSWRWVDSDLPLISEPSLDFSSMKVQEAVEAIQSWMNINFQHENNNPTLYSFIEKKGFPWGEPHPARTIIQEVFGHYLPADVLAAAITSISVDGETWFPHENRLPPDVVMPSLDTSTTHAQMQQCVKDADERIKALQAQRAEIGHNNPPEAIEEPPLTDEELAKIRGALATLRMQEPHPEDAGKGASEALLVLHEGGNKLRVWLSSFAVIAAASFANEAGKDIYVLANSAMFKVLGAALKWIEAIGGSLPL